MAGRRTRGSTGPGSRGAMAAGALGIAAGTATAMGLAGRTPDPWSAVLAAAFTIALLLAGAPRWTSRSPNEELDEHGDPVTGVGNVRAALALIDRELARAEGHGHVFSLALLELDHGLYATASSRRARRSRRGLFRTVAADLRLDDRVCRVPTAQHDLMLVLLPDTGPRGARDVAARLGPLVRDHLVEDGVAADGHLRVRTLAHPTDTPAIDGLRHRLQVLEDADALIRDIAVQPVRMARRPTDTQSLRLPETTATAPPRSA